MEHLGLNGVLVWTGITGGDNDVKFRLTKSATVGSRNKLLLGSVNANRHILRWESRTGTWRDDVSGSSRTDLTNPVVGLENYAEMMGCS